MNNRIITGTLLAVAAFALFTGCTPEEKQISEKKIKVELRKPELRHFRHGIQVQGVIEPEEAAAIASRVSGTIDEFKVSEGSKVKKGDILFLIDQKNLRNALTIAEQNYKVALEVCRTAEEDVNIAEITLRKAELDYKRNEYLMKSNAVSRTTFETTETDYKRAVANLRKVNAVLKYNKAQVDQAVANLEIARKNFEDSIVRAPYDGIITDKLCDAGEFAAVGKEVLKLESTSGLEVSARISALHYPHIANGTDIAVSIAGKKLCQAKIYYKSPSIEPMSRTFEIKAKLPAAPGIISGLLCDINIIFAQRQGYGLPSDAVIAIAGGKNAVFIVNGDTAKEVIAETGFVTDGFTELLNAKELLDAECVVSGQYFLNDGSKVEISGGNAK